MELIKCSDYVIKNAGWYESEVRLSYYDFTQSVLKYANFLKQQLAERYEINGVYAHPLNRFLICDLEGNVLMKPPNHNKWLRNDQERRGFINSEHEQYQESKDRVLFEGFEYEYETNHTIWVEYPVKYIYSFGRMRYKTIEDLTDLGLTLTKQAIKGL